MIKMKSVRYVIVNAAFTDITYVYISWTTIVVYSRDGHEVDMAHEVKLSENQSQISGVVLVG